jgi:eukaryotic-like serine/threonine-protein kinase
VPNIGESIGNYRLVAVLASGAFGRVYRAEHTVLPNLQTAIKFLGQERINDSQGCTEFLQEAHLLNLLRHPAILPVLDVGLSEGIPYIVTEYAPGGTLRSYLNRQIGQPVALAEALRILVPVGEALQYAHESKIVHCDLKPENIFFNVHNETLLADFGIAVNLGESNTILGNTGGTAPYMAPEQFAGVISPKCDQYALACIAYELLTGRKAFTASHATIETLWYQHARVFPPAPRQLNPDLPDYVETSLCKALAKDRNERHLDVATFMKTLQGRLPTSLSPHTWSTTEPDFQAIKALQCEDSAPRPAFATTPSLLEHEPEVVKEEAISDAPARMPESYATIPIRWRKSLHTRRRMIVYLSIVLLLIISMGGIAVQARNLLLSPGAVPTLTTAQHAATVTASIQCYERLITAHGIMFGFDAQHTHNNACEQILNPKNVSQLTQAWAVSLGTTNFSYATLVTQSSPTVANGNVYIGSGNDRLYAFDAQTGTLQWVGSTGGSIASSPAIIDGSVYVGSDDDQIYAFNAQTGAFQWAAATGYAINSSPVIYNYLVYVGSLDNKLYAFDRQKGTPVWTPPTTDSSIASSPAISNNMVFVGSDDGSVYAFDAQTGQQLWASPTGLTVESSPAIANGLVYIGSYTGNLYAFDALSGQRQWTAFIGQAIGSSPAVAEGIVYVGDDDGKLYAFNARTGAEKWAASTGGYMDSSPFVANGVVFVGSSDGRLYAFDAQTGTHLWTSPSTHAPITSSPAVANGMVYIASTNGKLYAFHLPGTKQ